jgi:hypothetical protein
MPRRDSAKLFPFDRSKAMARTSKAAKTTTSSRRSSSGAAASASAVDAANEASALGSDAARTMFDASMNASLNVLRFIEQMQQSQAQALKSLDQRPAAASASEGDGLQDLLGQQMTFAAEQFTSMAQLSTQVFAGVLDLERQWLEQMQAGAAELARGWLQSNAALTSPATRRALEMPADTSPIGLFNNAQAAFAEMTKVWIDAVNHDVQHA